VGRAVVVATGAVILWIHSGGGRPHDLRSRLPQADRSAPERVAVVHRHPWDARRDRLDDHASVRWRRSCLCHRRDRWRRVAATGGCAGGAVRPV